MTGVYPTYPTAAQRQRWVQIHPELRRVLRDEITISGTAAVRLADTVAWVSKDELVRLRLVRADGTLTRTCERLLDAMEGHA